MINSIDNDKPTPGIDQLIANTINNPEEANEQGQNEEIACAVQSCITQKDGTIIHFEYLFLCLFCVLHKYLRGV